jgi:hypothetical protein
MQMNEVVKPEKKNLWLEFFKGIWKPILVNSFKVILPYLKDLVKRTDNKWDDAAVGAVELLFNKFIGDEEKDA